MSALSLGLVLLGLAAWDAGPWAVPAPRRDRLGHTLPAGALYRFGSAELPGAAIGKAAAPPIRSGRHVAFSPDSRLVASSEDGAVVLVDAVRGKELRRWPADARPGLPLAFTPDGKALAVLDQAFDLHLWNVADGRRLRVIHGMNHHGTLAELVFSRDGRRLASNHYGRICLWDVASGKLRYSWPASGHAAVAPGIDRLAVCDPADRQMRLRDPTTGKARHALADYTEFIRFGFTRARGPYSVSAYFTPAFSPDGRRFLGAVQEPPDNALGVWDAATGKRLPLTLHGKTAILANVAFSPDSRLLALMHADCRMALWSVENGDLVRHLGQGIEEMAAPPVFTPDGRTVVTAVGSLVQFWEVATGGEIGRRTGHTRAVEKLVMARDGRKVATVSADGTILVWDAMRLAPPARQPAEPEALWAGLADRDARRARRAIETLVAAPAPAVALLRARLKPVAGPDARAVARWIAELGDDDFEQREKAMRELGQLGEHAHPAMRQALAGNPSLEARRRMEGLLKTASQPALAPDALRAIRSIQVLEALDDAEASRLLATLARGAAGARLTEEAAAALARRGK